MRTPYYREQALEGIACEVITAYDPNLYYGVPRMIPIEDIIEAQGITLEYQCLRKTGCVLGETIFDDGGAIIYDYDIPGYTVIAVKGGTISQSVQGAVCRWGSPCGTGLSRRSSCPLSVEIRHGPELRKNKTIYNFVKRTNHPASNQT